MEIAATILTVKTGTEDCSWLMATSQGLYSQAMEKDITILNKVDVLLQCNKMLTVYGLGPGNLKGEINSMNQRVENKRKI